MLHLTQALVSALLLFGVVLFILPSYAQSVDHSSLTVVQNNDSASEAGGNNFLCHESMMYMYIGPNPSMKDAIWT